MDEVTRFPVKSWQRTRNRRGKDTLSCIVSDRYLRFTPPEPATRENPVAVCVDVIKDGYGDGPDRKLCSLILNFDELRALVARYDAKDIPR